MSSNLVTHHTIYLLQTKSGKIELYEYVQEPNGRAITSPFALGLHITNPSADMSIGKVSCHRNNNDGRKLITTKEVCGILAKKTLTWDTNRPIGTRVSNVKQTSGFESFYEQYKTQQKQLA